MRYTSLAAAVTIAFMLVGGSAYAFHSGGVAKCDGCHTMHNSKGGAIMTRNALPVGTTNAYLLQGQDASSTCLKCHGAAAASAYGYRIFSNDAATVGTNPGNYTPGGDFGWLKKDFNYIVRGSPASSEGQRHGHNIVALDEGLISDTLLTTAPGGLYSASNLSCISCHDPHGKSRIMDAAGTIGQNNTIGVASLPISKSGSYPGSLPTLTAAVGVYRLLGGTGYVPKSVAEAPFVNNSPIAVAPSTYNRAEGTTETRVAYGQGMSEWCTNCHTNMHNDNYPTTLRHPSGNAAKLLAGSTLDNYNAYVKSGDLTGTNLTSYSSLVPFEEGTADRAVLFPHAVNDGTQTGGADAASNVMCLSCHRAHASGWDNMMRWNMESDFLTYSGEYPATDAVNPDAQNTSYSQGRTTAEVTAAYYGRAPTNFATYQRSLCNKCHAKD